MVGRRRRQTGGQQEKQQKRHERVRVFLMFYFVSFLIFLLLLFLHCFIVVIHRFKLYIMHGERFTNRNNNKTVPRREQHTQK